MWNSLSFLGIQEKTVNWNFNATENKNLVTYYLKSISKVFVDFIKNLAEFILVKTTWPPKKKNIEAIFHYYLRFAVPGVFHRKTLVISWRC